MGQMLNTRMKDNKILTMDMKKNEGEQQEFVIDLLFRYTMEKKWKEVLRLYQRYPMACEARLTKSEETALHIAVSNYHAEETDAKEHADVVCQLVESIPKEKAREILLLENKKGNTPLHLAAALGNASICESIAKVEALELIYKRNLRGETPLFLAAHHGKIEAFRCLCEKLSSEDKKDDSVCRRTDGDTILHSAISGECFELAFLIISHYPRLVTFINEEGFSPLHMLARKPNLFRSSSNLRLCDRMIYQCVTVREIKKPKLDSNSYKTSPCCQINDSYPANYQTCLNFMRLLRSAVMTMASFEKGRRTKEQTDEENQKGKRKEHQASVKKDRRTENQTGSTTDGGNQERKPEEPQASVKKDRRTESQTGSTTDGGNQERKPEEPQVKKDRRTESQTGSTTDGGNQERKPEEPQGKESKDEELFPPNYGTCIQFFKFAMNLMLIVLGIGIRRINKIREKKKKHEWAYKIMTELIQSESNYKYGNNGRTPTQNVESLRQEGFQLPEGPPYEPDEEENVNKGKEDKHVNKTDNECTCVSEAKTKDDKEKSKLHAAKCIIEMVEKILYKNDKWNDGTRVSAATSLLLAAKMGITEMVEKILETFPVAIQDVDANGKNALLLAVENRQINVFDSLSKMKLPEFVFYQVDNEGNSAIHLAAMFQKHHPWRIPGAALQMHWEIKWYKHVKKSMPPQCFIQYNKKGETASEIFRKTHENLVKAGSDWIIITSESCSVVAALIATVAFATSSTVPGGPDQNTGHPLLQNQPAFDVFSVASLVALCFSVTALVFFLAILTSRCQQQDFKHSLPRKLLFGLTSLFTSITAILISFCAGHFFILKDQMHNAAFAIYAVACLPITFFAFAQLRLYIDLLWSIWTKVPLRSYKVFHN